MEASPAVLTLSSVSRDFNGGDAPIRALESFSARFLPGRLSVVQGPSGCGKSTVLAIAGTLDRPTAGEVDYAGRALARLSPVDAARFRRDHLSFVFQDGGLLEGLTTLHNVILPLLYRRIPAAAARDRARLAINQLGLADQAQRNVTRLSGGERLRVGLARALAADREILICDEPTAALDQAQSEQVGDLLRDLARAGRVVVCATHDPVLISRADDLLTLSHGVLRAPEP